MGENVLAHYGIRGMKWGVRRYQNKDGSLTAAGKKRYSGDGGNAGTTKSTTSSSSGRKKVSEMTDDELNSAVRRLQLEQQYRQLNPEKVSAGQKFVNKVAKDVIIPAATTVARNAVQKVMQDAVSKALKTDIKIDNDNKKKDK